MPTGLRHTPLKARIVEKGQTHSHWPSAQLKARIAVLWSLAEVAEPPYINSR